MPRAYPRFVGRRSALLLSVGASAAALLAACSQPSASTPSSPTQPIPAPPPASTVPPKTAASPATAPSPTAAAQAPAQKAPPTPLRITMGTPRGLFEAMSVELGKRRGILKEIGVDLDMQYTGGDVLNLQAVIGGQFLTADMGPGIVTAAAAGGADARIVGTNCTKTHFAIFAHPSITSVEQLQGKTIGGVAPGTAPNQAMAAWLKVKGVDPASVNFVNIGPTPEIYKSIVANKVQAGPAGADFLPAAKRDGLNVLTDYMSGDIPGFFILSFAALAKNLDGNQREPLVRTLSAWALMNRLYYDNRNKDEWVQLAGEINGQPAGDAAFFWDWIQQHRFIAANLEFTPEQVQYVQEQNVQAGQVQSAVLSFDKVATNELRDEALKRVGEFTYPS